MTSLPSAVLLGFVLGVQHATDADHLVAVGTILTRARRFRDGAAIGALWGLGHMLTLTLAGVAIVGLDLSLAPRLGAGVELAVAAMLVALGVVRLRDAVRGYDAVPAEHLVADHAHGHLAPWGAPGAPQAPLRSEAPRRSRGAPRPTPPNARQRPGKPVALLGLGFSDKYLEALHSHPHAHGGRLHQHPHVHPGRRLLAALSAGRGSRRRALVVGAVHGMAGTAAVSLLIVATLDSAWSVLGYLAVFGLGTLLGMTSLTAALAYPLTIACRVQRVRRLLALGAGVGSIAFGIFYGLKAF